MLAVWTDVALRARLQEVGREVRHLARISVSQMDVDMERARARSLERRRSRLVFVAVLVVFVLTLLLLPRFRAAAGSGLGGMWVWVVVSGVLQYRGRPRVGPAKAGSQAEGFVTALLWPTTVTSAIAGRWLAWNEAADAVLLSQEERWSYAGPQSGLKVRWTSAEGVAIAVAPAGSRWRPLVRITFMDESDVVLDLPKSSREELLRAGWTGS